jgi:hypothetical protein
MSHVEYETDGAVALVTLAKPPHNLIDAALTDGIVTAAAASGDRPGPACRCGDGGRDVVGQ